MAAGPERQFRAVYVGHFFADSAAANVLRLTSKLMKKAGRSAAGCEPYARTERGLGINSPDLSSDERDAWARRAHCRSERL
jgi:hypothetical protein